MTILLRLSCERPGELVMNQPPPPPKTRICGVTFTWMLDGVTCSHTNPRLDNEHLTPDLQLYTSMRH